MNGGTRVTLRYLYASVFGSPPRPEVAATFDRLDLYLHNQPIGTVGLMIVVMLRPVDMFIAATSAAERQLRETQLAFDTRATQARSDEAHVIARMADTIKALSEDLIQQRIALRHRTKDERADRISWRSVGLNGLVTLVIVLGGRLIN